MHVPTDIPTPQVRSRRWLGILLLLFVGGCGTWLGFVVRDKRREAQASCMKCELKYLVLAFHNYHEAYGSFPPAVVRDEQARPLYSWRVVLLPYLDQLELYKQFHLDEPWDSPHNLQFADQMPVTFHARTEPESKRFTNYVVISGEFTPFPHGGVRSLDDVLDDKGNTILASEITESDIVWSEPRDLDFDEMSLKLNDPDKHGISSVAWRQPVAAMVDGSVRKLPQDVASEELLGLLTISGQENVTLDELNGRLK
ncbi:MAG: DUF1559 domain-containing protein [Planctomycetaceae bacterium]